MPSPDEYQKPEMYEWSSKLRIIGGKIEKGKKESYIDKIQKLSKVKEKSSPGVGTYDPEAQWK